MLIVIFVSVYVGKLKFHLKTSPIENGSVFPYNGWKVWQSLDAE